MPEADTVLVITAAIASLLAGRSGSQTPVVATHDLIQRHGRPSDAETREALAGNLCRCTGYEKILDAVRLAADRLAEPGTGADR